MNFIVFLIIFIKCSSAQYNGHKVFDVYPRREHDNYILQILSKDSALDFWVKRSEPYQVWTIMVPPSHLNEFERIMTSNKIDYTEFISDLQMVLQIFDVSVKQSIQSVVLTEYPSYNVTYQYLKDLEAFYPNTVTVLNFERTYEGRELFGVKISSSNSLDVNNKPGILISAGLSGREWIGPITALYIIDQLVNLEENNYMYENVNWYFLPLMNPDGYEYSRSTDRLWRKNRTPGTKCFGVDLTKNFATAWGESGSNIYHQCFPEYIGPSNFSEPETRALKIFMDTYGSNIKLYLSLRSYGPALLYPFAHTTYEVINKDEHQTLGEQFNTVVMESSIGYPVDAYWNTYSVVGGMDIDWMKTVAEVPLVYSLHLAGGENDFLDPFPWEIKTVVEHIFKGMSVFSNYVGNKWPQSEDNALEKEYILTI